MQSAACHPEEPVFWATKDLIVHSLIKENVRRSLANKKESLDIDVNPASGFAVVAIVFEELRPMLAPICSCVGGLLTLDSFRVRFGFKF